MNSFFDVEAAKVAIEAMLKECATEPGGQEVVQVQRFQFAALQTLAPMLAMRLSKAIDAAHDAHEKRIAELEERLRTAEAKSAMRYRGVWNPDEQYSAGDFTTHQGSVWHCREVTHDRPGENSLAWQLAVKKGRDGKDAR